MRPGLVSYHTEYSDRLREEGQLKEARRFLLEIAEHRRLDLTGEQRSRVEECSDLHALERWRHRAWEASTGAEVFERVPVPRPSDSSFKVGYHSEYSDRVRAEGFAQGFMEVRLRAVLHRVIAGRGWTLTDGQREHIDGCSDVDTLGRWLRRAAAAPDTEGVFGESPLSGSEQPSAAFGAEYLEDLGREARAEGARCYLLVAAEYRELELSDRERRRVDECSDAETLERWRVRAWTASTAAEIFA